MVQSVFEPENFCKKTYEKSLVIINKFPGNPGAVNVEQGDRFHQDIK